MAWHTLIPGTLWELTDAQLEAYLKRWGGMPKVFITGDAHRTPPFQWIECCKSNRLRDSFKTLVDEGKLCAHVEEYDDDVSIKSVPHSLARLHSGKRVFGWELDVYRYLQPVMEEFNDYWASGGLPDALNHGKEKTLSPSYRAGLIQHLEGLDGSIREADRRLNNICFPDELKGLNGKVAEHREQLTYYKALFKPSHPAGAFQQSTARAGAKPKKPGNDYAAFLMNYYSAANALRISKGVHVAISTKINHLIQLHSECTHLITCGNDHLFRKVCAAPLNELIQLVGPVTGVVDADSGEGRVHYRQVPVRQGWSCGIS